MTKILNHHQLKAKTIYFKNKFQKDIQMRS